MEDYIRQAVEDRKRCQDFLIANPEKHSCVVIRPTAKLNQKEERPCQTQSAATTTSLTAAM